MGNSTKSNPRGIIIFPKNRILGVRIEDMVALINGKATIL